MTTTVGSSRLLQGELPPFIRRRLGLRAPRRFSYDSLVRVRLGERVFMLTHPDDVRHVLVANAANYEKTPRLTSVAGRERAGAGLLTATGGVHLRQRKLLQPLFRRRVVAVFDRRIAEATDAMLERWATADRVDLAGEMTELTKSIMLAVLFGEESADLERAELGAAIAERRRFTELVYHGRLPGRTRLPTPVVRGNRWALGILDSTIYEAIERRRDRVGSDDLISELVRATYEDGSKMTDRQVRDEVLTFTGTGYETLGDGLAWTWALLGGDAGVEAKLDAELATVLDGRRPLAGDVQRLSYTEAVLAETLRLRPPTWLFARIPTADDVLPAGGPIRAGSTLYVCPYVLHRHPRYFPDPERFAPDRFGPGVRPPRYAYLPFGDGLHRCLGEHLARLEAVLVVARVAQRFRLELVDDGPVRPEAGITLRPRGALWARPLARNEANGR